MSILYNKVVANNQILFDISSDTVTEANVLQGVTFHKNNGAVAQGTLQTVTTESIVPSATQQTISTYNGKLVTNDIVINAVTNTIDANIIAGNIKKGVTILGITGTYEGDPVVSAVHLKDDYLKTINEADSSIISTATTLRFSKTASDISGATKINTVSLGSDGDIFAYKNGTNLIIYSEGTIKAFTPTFDEETYDIKGVICYMHLTDIEQMAGDLVFMYALQTVNLENFDTSDLTSMKFLLGDIKGALGGEETVSSITFGQGFTTASVTDMSYLFFRLNLTSLDISGFNIDNATNTSNMFGGNIPLTTIYVSANNSDWTNKSVTTSDGMFDGCQALPNYDSSAIDISKAKLSTNGGYFTLKVGE